MTSKIAIEISSSMKSPYKIKEITLSHYCDDCLYNWCTKRQKVTFCMMKTRGLFECRTCMLQLINNNLKLSNEK